MWRVDQYEIGDRGERLAAGLNALAAEGFMVLKILPLSQPSNVTAAVLVVAARPIGDDSPDDDQDDEATIAMTTRDRLRLAKSVA